MLFTKMHGTGNDFILIEDFKNKLLESECELAEKICHRKFGIGADGLVIIRNSDIADIKMEIINKDGSRANMCGNAIRCFVKYIFEKNIVAKEEINIETKDGIKIANIFLNSDNIVTEVEICMGKASFNGKDIPLNNLDSLINQKILVDKKEFVVSSVLMGVPHTIIIDNDNKFNVYDGKLIEKHSLFLEGTNVNFVKILDDENIEVSTWERGAGATYSCGTGCSASVVITNKLNLTRDKVNVKIKGGELKIRIQEQNVYMKGSANIICSGEFYSN